MPLRLPAVRSSEVDEVEGVIEASDFGGIWLEKIQDAHGTQRQGMLREMPKKRDGNHAP